MTPSSAARGPDLEGAALVGSLAATLGALLLAAGSGLPPVQRPLTFGLVFWGWYVLACWAFALAIVLAAWLPLRAAGHAPLASRAAGVLGVVLLVLLSSQNPQALQELMRLAGPWRYRVLAPLSFALAALGLVALALEPSTRRVRARWLSAAATACFVLAFLPTTEAGDRGAPALSPPATSRPLLLVGVDGADWKLMEPLIARGELPHLASLRARGAWGPLKTFQPTRSPAIWTTVVTGKPPSEHGVLGFMDVRLRGVNGVLPELKPPDSPGFARLHQLLQASGQLFETPVASSSRRVPAFWNIASLHGSPVNVVNWWATWPAEAINGNMISELPFFRPRDPRPEARLTHPESLRGDVARHVVEPSQLSLGDARRFAAVTPQEFAAMQGPTAELRQIQWLAHFVSLFESTRRLASFVCERTPEADLLVLFRLVDMTSHVALRDSELVDDHLDATADEVRKYGGAVSEAYRATDRALGELLQRFPDANVVVVSDHGFRVQQEGERRFYGHEDAPDGVFLAAGPAIRQARVEGLSVYDVFPLLLYLKGFPVADDLPGRAPRTALDEGYLAAHAERRIASYGRRAPSDLQPAAAVVDIEARRRLRALGYIN